MADALPWIGQTPIDESAPLTLAPSADGGALPWAGQIPLNEPKKVVAPSGFLTGLQDPGVGLGQLGVHLSGGNYAPDPLAGGWSPAVLEDRPPGAAVVKGVDDMVHQREADYEAQRAAAGQSGLDWWRAAGNIASPINLMTPGGGGTGLVGRLATGAARGAIAGAEQPVTGDSYWTDKGLQAGAGAAVGAPMEAAGMLVRGRVKPDVAALEDAGVQLTPGQSGGLIAKANEGLATKLPIAKSLVSAQQEGAINSFSRGAYNQALKQIDDALPQDVGAGHEAATAAYQKISDYYDALKPKLAFAADEPYLTGVANVASQVEKELGPTEVKRFYNIINPVLTDNLSGDALKAADSDLATFARKYTGTDNPDLDTLGVAVGKVRQLVRDQLGRSNPEAKTQLDSVDRAYAMLGVADRAANAARADQGVFTPAQLLNAGATGPFGASTRQVAQGNALLQPYADTAQRVIGSKRGAGASPATAGDLATMALLEGGTTALGLGGMGVAGAGESGNGPDWLKWGGAAAIPMLMFSRGGQGLLSSFGPGRSMRGLLGNAAVAGPASAATGLLSY